MVKLKKDDKESLKGRQPDQFYYARINVSLDVTTVIIRILPEDPSNPPYKIVNRTNFLINYQQRTKYDKNDRKKHHINIGKPFFSLEMNDYVQTTERKRRGSSFRPTKARISHGMSRHYRINW